MVSEKEKYSLRIFQLRLATMSQFFFIQKKLNKKSQCDARSDLSIVPLFAVLRVIVSTWKIISKNIAIFFRMGFVYP
jgi:hypothetical protein